MDRHYIAPALGTALLWAASAAGILAFLPDPLRPVDYFLAGGVGTLVAAATVFAGFAKVSGVGNLLYKRRSKTARPERAGASGILGI